MKASLQWGANKELDEMATSKTPTKTGSNPTTSLETAIDASQSADELLSEVASTDKTSYSLRVSSDNISLLLDCSDPLGNLEATISRIEADFLKMELPEYPDTETLSKILETGCKPGESVFSFPIMKGWKAIPGQNGRLEWAKDFFSTESELDDENKVHDFWDHNDQQSVEMDELLALVHYPIPGKTGLDVYCQEIPVTKSESIKLRSGKGVRQVDEGAWLAYYAEHAGRIKYLDETLMVDDVYVIQGDVSLETGNIKHTGTVHVEGDVKTGATIESDGDILVKGMLDPCHIRCGGSLTVCGGIVGLEEYLIQVEGDLQAMYISGAVVQSGGSVTVQNEITHSNIKAYGKVMVPTGRIAGGEIVAREGIQVAMAGASGSTVTLLVVGVDFTIDRKVAERETKIKKLEEVQDKIDEALSKAKLALNTDSETETPLLVELAGKSKIIGEAIIKEYTAKRVEQTSKKIPDCEVLIMRELWSGTSIQIRDIKTIVRTSIEKPRVARLKNSKVSVLPLGDGNMPGG